jgi:hypothetical protein
VEISQAAVLSAPKGGLRVHLRMQAGSHELNLYAHYLNSEGGLCVATQDAGLRSAEADLRGPPRAASSGLRSADADLRGASAW